MTHTIPCKLSYGMPNKNHADDVVHNRAYAKNDIDYHLPVYPRLAS